MVSIKLLFGRKPATRAAEEAVRRNAEAYREDGVLQDARDEFVQSLEDPGENDRDQELE